MFGEGTPGLTVASIVMSFFSGLAVLLHVIAVFIARQKTSASEDVSERDVTDAMAQLKAGASIRQIEERLAERGMDPAGVAATMRAIETKKVHKAGWRNLVIGGSICVLGIVATVGTYLIAANAPGGGPYIVAYGLIIAGGLQATRGLIQVGK